MAYGSKKPSKKFIDSQFLIYLCIGFVNIFRLIFLSGIFPIKLNCHFSCLSPLLHSHLQNKLTLTHTQGQPLLHSRGVSLPLNKAPIIGESIGVEHKIWCPWAQHEYKSPFTHCVHWSLTSLPCVPDHTCLCNLFTTSSEPYLLRAKAAKQPRSFYVQVQT